MKSQEQKEKYASFIETLKKGAEVLLKNDCQPVCFYYSKSLYKYLSKELWKQTYEQVKSIYGGTMYFIDHSAHKGKGACYVLNKNGELDLVKGD